MTAAVSRLAIAGACVAGLWWTASSAAPQQKPPEQAPRQPPIRTQANYVRVDVYPTADGRPLEGLRAEDFEVLEDGVPQAIENFQHVTITAIGPQALRAEPNSVEASRQAAANPNARAFVVFLDVGHVSIEGTWQIREPLIGLINRIVGPEDVVGIMTPEMSPAQITFARRTEVVEAGLREAFPWGQRHTIHEDPRDKDYADCYPLLVREVEQGLQESELLTKMRARRRERVVLDALRDLSMYMRTLREGRTAVIAVTEGWLLYRPDPQMMELRKDCTCFATGGDPRTCQNCKPLGEEAIPGVDPIGVGPGGKLGRGVPFNTVGGLLKSSCDTDRMNLAQMDNDAYFRSILDDANRANISFYPIDPRGLAVFDSPIGPKPPPTIVQDRAFLKARHESMENMAAATDGIAVMSSNNLNVGLRRIADDLTSYYLLGYYSTNPKLDGRFRRITVRVKKPGVDVRARRGYRAPTEEEVATARSLAPAAPLDAETVAFETAMGALARIRPEARFRVHAAPAVAGDATTVWVAGELQPLAPGDPWTKGGTADIEVSAGGATATAKVTIAAGERGFVVPVHLGTRGPGRQGAGGPGGQDAIEVRVRLAGVDPDAARLADSYRVPAAASGGVPLLFRRGSTTGNRYLPVATFLFSRTERLRIEIPVAAGATAGEGRVLDRSRQLLPVPVAVTTRTEGDRSWIVADVTLAPLGAGDYVVEVGYEAGGAQQKTVVAVRVTR